MAERKSIGKFSQYLVAYNLKDVYFQDIFDFLAFIEEKSIN